MRGRSERPNRLLERRAIFNQGQRIVRGGAQTRGFHIGQTLAFFDQRAQKLRRFVAAHAAQGFDGLDAHELVAQDVMFAGGDLHELRHGRGFLRQTDLVDHHRHDHGMRVGEDRGEYESSTLGRRGIGRPGKLAHRQILKVPFPTRHCASEAAQQALRISSGQQLDRCGHALAARFVEPGFEKVEYGHADSSQEARHSWHHLRAVGFC